MIFFKKVKRNYFIAFILGCLFFLLAFSLADSDKYKTIFTESYKIKTPYLPATVEFCGEKMPINEQDIKERMDRELMSTVFWQSNTMMLMKRSKKYFPVIEPILKENGIPDDFKYLCVHESGLSNAASPAGAKGFWQLMEGTSKPLGLEINEYVDERYHLEKATRAACLYFRESYATLNNWTLVATSYNRGQAGTGRDLASQEVNSFYDLHMNDETSRYIFRIMAYKLIFENPELYGFYLKMEDYYKIIPSKIDTVDSSINSLSEFAKSKGTNYKMLKLLNPWLRDKTLPNKGRKKYVVVLPKE
ncbi:MAG: lytic transglycosylase domain-containing protein [Bacteroidia bacterium]